MHPVIIVFLILREYDFNVRFQEKIPVQHILHILI